jgi:hypothetical protein
MRPHSPESSHINHTDHDKGMPLNESKEAGNIGFEAEEAVMDYFSKEFPEFMVRPATPEEDRGQDGISSGKQIDSVLYLGEQPSAGLQITTATDSKVRLKKMTELKNRPFVRLREMNLQDTSIPKAIIFVEAGDVRSYMEDRNLSKHPGLTNQILDSFENSLKFDLLQTKNPKEQKKIAEILSLLKIQRDRTQPPQRIH